MPSWIDRPDCLYITRGNIAHKIGLSQLLLYFYIIDPGLKINYCTSMFDCGWPLSMTTCKYITYHYYYYYYYYYYYFAGIVWRRIFNLVDCIKKLQCLICYVNNKLYFVTRCTDQSYCFSSTQKKFSIWGRS
jgi:hypothetical protein